MFAGVGMRLTSSGFCKLHPPSISDFTHPPTIIQPMSAAGAPSVRAALDHAPARLPPASMDPLDVLADTASAVGGVGEGGLRASHGAVEHDGFPINQHSRRPEVARDMHPEPWARGALASHRVGRSSPAAPLSTTASASTSSLDAADSWPALLADGASASASQQGQGDRFMQSSLAATSTAGMQRRAPPAATTINSSSLAPSAPQPNGQPLASASLQRGMPVPLDSGRSGMEEGTAVIPGAVATQQRLPFAPEPCTARDPRVAALLSSLAAVGAPLTSRPTVYAPLRPTGASAAASLSSGVGGSPVLTHQPTGTPLLAPGSGFGSSHPPSPMVLVAGPSPWGWMCHWMPSSHARAFALPQSLHSAAHPARTLLGDITVTGTSPAQRHEEGHVTDDGPASKRARVQCDSSPLQGNPAPPAPSIGAPTLAASQAHGVRADATAPRAHTQILFPAAFVARAASEGGGGLSLAVPLTLNAIATGTAVELGASPWRTTGASAAAHPATRAPLMAADTVAQNRPKGGADDTESLNASLRMDHAVAHPATADGDGGSALEPAAFALTVTAGPSQHQAADVVDAVSARHRAGVRPRGRLGGRAPPTDVTAAVAATGEPVYACAYCEYTHKVAAMVRASRGSASVHPTNLLVLDGHNVLARTSPVLHTDTPQPQPALYRVSHDHKHDTVSLIALYT